MEQRPGSIFLAITPDFDTPIVNIGEVGNIQRCIGIRMTKVLVLGGSTIDCNCLPIFDEETSHGAYLPVGDEGYVNPLLMYRIAFKNFYQPYFPLSKAQYKGVSKHIQSLYKLGIEQGCQKFFWAETPINDNPDTEKCILKRRPVITMQPGLYFPTSTNHGRYSAPGPAICFGSKPGKVSFVPIHLPKNVLYSTRGVTLPAKDKSIVQEHLLYHLPKVFTNPY